MTLGQYSRLAEAIHDARFRGKITPEDAEEMLRHIVDDSHARFWRGNCIALALALLAGLALTLTY